MSWGSNAETGGSRAVEQELSRALTDYYTQAENYLRGHESEIPHFNGNQSDPDIKVVRWEDKDDFEIALNTFHWKDYPDYTEGLLNSPLVVPIFAEKKAEESTATLPPQTFHEPLPVGEPRVELPTEDVKPTGNADVYSFPTAADVEPIPPTDLNVEEEEAEEEPEPILDNVVTQPVPLPTETTPPPFETEEPTLETEMAAVTFLNDYLVNLSKYVLNRIDSEPVVMPTFPSREELNRGAVAELTLDNWNALLSKERKVELNNENDFLIAATKFVGQLLEFLAGEKKELPEQFPVFVRKDTVPAAPEPPRPEPAPEGAKTYENEPKHSQALLEFESDVQVYFVFLEEEKTPFPTFPSAEAISRGLPHPIDQLTLNTLMENSIHCPTGESYLESLRIFINQLEQYLNNRGEVQASFPIFEQQPEESEPEPETPAAAPETLDPAVEALIAKNTRNKKPTYHFEVLVLVSPKGEERMRIRRKDLPVYIRAAIRIHNNKLLTLTQPGRNKKERADEALQHYIGESTPAAVTESDLSEKKGGFRQAMAQPPSKLIGDFFEKRDPTIGGLKPSDIKTEDERDKDGNYLPEPSVSPPNSTTQPNN